MKLHEIEISLMPCPVNHLIHIGKTPRKLPSVWLATPSVHIGGDILENIYSDNLELFLHHVDLVLCHVVGKLAVEQSRLCSRAVR